MSGIDIGDAFGFSGFSDALGSAFSSIVGGALNLMTNLAVPKVPNPGQPAGPGTPPADKAAAAPSQAAQRPQNSAGQVSAGSSGSTILTGPAGVLPSTLTLGRNTLLGQ